MTTKQIHQAFLNTSFRVLAKPEFNIKINSEVLELNHLITWAFLTAWNPLPVVLGIEENSKRNKDLEEDIKKLGLNYIQGIGISEDEKWHEESYLIENISKEDIQILAKKYGQLAYVFGSRNEIAHLIYTE